MEKNERVIMNMITSNKLIIKSCTIMKVGLSPYDDKRFIMNDKITLAHRHYKIFLLKDDDDNFCDFNRTRFSYLSFQMLLCDNFVGA